MLRIIETQQPSVALVISTFAGVPHVHLALESWRRNHPETPVMVHDDGGHQTETLHGLCRRYGALFFNIHLRPTAFRGDIHLSSREKSWYSQVQEVTKAPTRFWIIVAGGKRDYTAQWWDRDRFQQVVEHFIGRILFVQVGEKDHHHPHLANVIDLRGKTDLRQLVRLVDHSQRVLCPVTLLMHLAAAVELKDRGHAQRPCVVVAGGREPVHWEAYPAHQFMHTIGAVTCCDHGGCWKSRVLPLGDGDEEDRPVNLWRRCRRVAAAMHGHDHGRRRDSAHRDVFRGGAISYLATGAAGIGESTARRRVGVRS